jgi:hypothetical protein
VGSWQLGQEAERIGQAAHAPTADSRIGDRIHAFLAGVPDEDGKEIKLNDTEQATADTLQDLATSQIERIFGDSTYGKLTEKRLWLTLKGELVLSGQFDLCVYRDALALIQDFKTGHREPEPAETNAQLKILCVLTAIALPNAREIIGQIISPFYGITEVRYDLSALSIAYNEIMETLDKIHDPQAALSPGVIQCRHCPGSNICSAVKDLQMPMTLTRVEALPDGAEAAWILDKATLLQKHLEEIIMYYRGRCSADPAYQIPGYDLVPGANVREISDWPKARAVLAKYVPDRELEAMPTIGSLERALGDALKLKPKQAKEKLNQLLDGLFVVKQNAPSFKRVNGKTKIAALAAGTEK